MPTPGVAVQIDPSQDTNFVGSNEGFIVQESGWRNYWGPFVIGGNLYLVAEKEGAPPVTSSSTIHIYKSTDSGDTWVLKDSSNSPITIDHTATIAIPQSGSLLRLCYLVVNGSKANINQIDFNTTTDTWGTAITGGPTFGVLPGTSTKDPRSIKLVTLSDRIRLIYHNTIGADVFESLCYADVIGGAWSSIDTLIFTYSDATLIPTPLVVFLGNSNLTHIFFIRISTSDLSSSTDGKLYWCSLSSGGIASSVLTAAPHSEVNGGVYYNMGLGALWGSKIVVPYAYNVSPPRNFRTTTGNAESSPTFTFDIVSNKEVQIFDTLYYNTSFLIIDGNNVLHAFFESQTVDGTTNFIYHNWNSGSGWQATDDLVFDSSTIPGFNYPTHNLGVGIVSVSGSTITFGIMFDEIGSHTMFYTTFVWTGSGPPPGPPINPAAFTPRFGGSAPPVKFIQPPFVQGRIIPTQTAPCPPWALLLPLQYTAELGCFCISTIGINPAVLVTTMGSATSFPFLFKRPYFQPPQYVSPVKFAFS